MQTANLDVVIPVSERPEVAATLFSLFRCGSFVRKTIVVDASQSGAVGSELSRLFAGEDRLVILSRPRPVFSKSVALNAGLLHCEAEFVLVSDADVIWSGTTLASMRTNVERAVHFCHVRHVEETDGANIAVQRRGYDYRLAFDGQEAQLTIVRRMIRAAGREGPGLVLARLSDWHRIGGYFEGFEGWGWEDKDLLIRAALLGRRITRAGRVLHLSHSDQRRQSQSGVDPAASRNANIAMSLRRIATGNHLGDLRPNAAGPLRPPKVRIGFDSGVAQELRFDNNPDFGLC
jgi:predicted glycosyltransferase involved in capsule biosynthesis